MLESRRDEPAGSVFCSGAAVRPHPLVFIRFVHWVFAFWVSIPERRRCVRILRAGLVARGGASRPGRWGHRALPPCRTRGAHDHGARATGHGEGARNGPRRGCAQRATARVHATGHGEGARQRGMGRRRGGRGTIQVRFTAGLFSDTLHDRHRKMKKLFYI